MGENIVLAEEYKKVQQKLNQWRHTYDIKIITVSPPAIHEGKVFITMVVVRTPKKE